MVTLERFVRTRLLNMKEARGFNNMWQAAQFLIDFFINKNDCHTCLSRDRCHDNESLESEALLKPCVSYREDTTAGVKKEKQIIEEYVPDCRSCVNRETCFETEVLESEDRLQACMNYKKEENEPRDGENESPDLFCENLDELDSAIGDIHDHVLKKKSSGVKAAFNLIIALNGDKRWRAYVALAYMIDPAFPGLLEGEEGVKI